MIVYDGTKRMIKISLINLFSFLLETIYIPELTCLHSCRNPFTLLNEAVYIPEKTHLHSLNESVYIPE